MSGAIAARRYAGALFQIGTEKGTLEELKKELRIVREVFQENEQLYTFLKHPRINNAKKKQFLNEVFQGLQSNVVHTISLLVERGRIEITPSIIDHFIQMVNDAKGNAEVTVYSVRALSSSEKTELEKSFSKRFNKQNIELENEIDPSLIGGLKIRVGNTIYDGSVKGKLHRIERDIATANK